LTPLARVSPTTLLSFDEVLRRLRERDVVDGLVVIGSLATDRLNAVSDYDLYVVLSAMPVPFHVGLTWVDGRLTDLVFEEAAAIDRFLARGDGVPENAAEERLVRYATTGRIVLDRHGRLEHVQRGDGRATPPMPWTNEEVYSAWFGANYNLQQTKRMLLSDDHVYGRAVDMRLLYSTADLIVAYFQLRALPWRGEKEAIRYLATQDPEFLSAFEAYADATDRAGRVRAYERLADIALAPWGGIWPQGATAFAFERVASVPADAAQIALAFWEDLLAVSSE
jgi:hypothetical protein